MSTRRGKVIFWFGAVVFGALAFLFASSYLIWRDQPRWLAAAVGALAFPVLPVAWQIFGERRRKKVIAASKTPPPKDALSSSDRYVLRAIAVVLVVIGPMVAVGKLDVVRAAWKYKTWFVPEDPGSYSEPGGSASKTAFLKFVPDEAELVIIGHEDPKDAKPGKDPGFGMLAYGDDQIVVVANDDKGEDIDAKIKSFNDDDRDKIPFLKVDRVARVKSDGDTIIVASERWTSKVSSSGAGPNAALRTELDRAPDGAQLVAAFVPRKGKHDDLGIRSGAAWLVSTDEKLTVDARVEVLDVAAADKVVTEVKTKWNAKGSDLPAKCRDEIDQVLDRVRIERTGTLVTFHVELPKDKLLGIMFCGFGK
jgi:hypothetical protein